MSPQKMIIFLAYLIQASYTDQNITTINTTPDNFRELYEKHINALNNHDVESLKEQADVIRALIEKTKDKLTAATVDHSLNATGIAIYTDLLVELIYEFSDIRHEIKTKSERKPSKLHKTLKRPFHKLRHRMRHDKVQDLLNEKVEGDIRSIENKSNDNHRNKKEKWDTSESFERSFTKGNSGFARRQFKNSVINNDFKKRRPIYHDNDEESRGKLNKQTGEVQDEIENYVPKWKLTFGALRKYFLNRAQKRLDSKRDRKKDNQNRKEQNDSRRNSEGERAIRENETNHRHKEEPTEEFDVMKSKRTGGSRRYLGQIKRIHGGNHKQDNEQKNQSHYSQNTLPSSGKTRKGNTNNSIEFHEKLDESTHNETNRNNLQDEKTSDDVETNDEMNTILKTEVKTLQYDDKNDDSYNNTDEDEITTKTRIRENKNKELDSKNEQYEYETDTDETLQSGAYDNDVEDGYKTKDIEENDDSSVDKPKDFLNQVVSLFHPPASLLRNETALERSPCDPITGIGVSLLCLASFVSILSLVLSVTNFVLNDARARNIFSFHSKA